MAEGCLESVWEVSGGCVSDSGYCLRGMMCKQLMNTQLDLSLLAGSVSPSCLELVRMCYISGCLRGVWGLSE